MAGIRTQVGWRMRMALLAAASAIAVIAAPGSTRPAAANEESVVELGCASPVYVTNSDNVGDGAAATVTRFATDADGRLVPVEKVPAAHGVRGMVFTRDGRFAYAAATQANEILMFRVGPGGALEDNGSVSVEAPFGIEIGPDGRTVYVVQTLKVGMLRAYAVELGGRLVLHDAVSTGDRFPKEPAVTPDGRFVYVSHGQPVDEHESLLTGFAIETDGGFGEQVAKETAGRSGAQTIITPDGRFLYSTQQASDEVVGWRIATDGRLREVVRQPVGDFVEGAAISPDGTLLYVGSFGGPPRLDGRPDPSRPSALFGFRIGAYGDLTPVAKVPTIDPIGLAFSPDGRRLYVSAYTTDTANSLKTFAVDPTGDLTQLQALASGGPLPAFHSVNIPPSRWSCQ